MRKALFRKDLWKDVGKKKKDCDTETGEEEEEEEKPRLHQNHYNHTRRIRTLGILQIIIGCTLYFTSILLPIFGTRHWLTEYLIPMGSISGAVSVVTGIFARETCRARKKWMIITYVILCSCSAVPALVQIVGAFAAFGKEAWAYSEGLITEPVIAFFRQFCYFMIIVMNMAIVSFAAINIILDLRKLSPTCRERFLNYGWMLEKGKKKNTELEDVVSTELPVTTV